MEKPKLEVVLESDNVGRKSHRSRSDQLVPRLNSALPEGRRLKCPQILVSESHFIFLTWRLGWLIVAPRHAQFLDVILQSLLNSYTRRF